MSQQQAGVFFVPEKSNSVFVNEDPPKVKNPNLNISLYKSIKMIRTDRTYTKKNKVDCVREEGEETSI